MISLDATGQGKSPAILKHKHNHEKKKLPTFSAAAILASSCLRAV